MKLQQLLKTKHTTMPVHKCKGIEIANSEKEVITEALHGLQDSIKDSMQELEQRETSFIAFTRIKKDYDYLQLQLQTINSLFKKL